MKFLQKMVKAVVIMALMFASLAPSSTPIASAQVNSLLSKPFGGEIIYPVPPTLLCPVAHTVIFDYVSNRPIGIATVFNTKVYDYGNLISPSTPFRKFFVMGDVKATPIPCVALVWYKGILIPYSVYPINEVGTSAF